MKTAILQAFSAVALLAVLGLIGRADYCDQKLDVSRSAALSEALKPAPRRMPSLKHISLSPERALAQLEQHR